MVSASIHTDHVEYVYLSKVTEYTLVTMLAKYLLRFCQLWALSWALGVTGVAVRGMAMLELLI